MSRKSPLRLADLPPPPPGKTGWPWTEESPALPAALPDGSAWPRLSIVTASLNPGALLEHTLRSVLLQNYPNLEYIVMDGGSTDESAAILRRYEPFLDFVVSERDRGQVEALNQGLARAAGSLLAFLDADDFYLPGAFAAAASAFHEAPPADLVYGGCAIVDQAGRELIEHRADISSLAEILDFENVWRANREFIQPETFWRRSLFEKTGPFNPNIGASFCYEFWCRALIAGAVLRRTDPVLACFRLHPGQKSHRETDRSEEEYYAMAKPWLWDKSVPLSASDRRRLQGEWLYHTKYIPAFLAAAKRGDPAWRRWPRTAWLCARHPQILASQAFRPHLQKLARLFRRLGGKPASA
jgi:glycosyltransferase involved in cell wall biosynthesis